MRGLGLCLLLLAVLACLPASSGTRIEVNVDVEANSAHSAKPAEDVSHVQRVGPAAEIDSFNLSNLRRRPTKPTTPPATPVTPQEESAASSPASYLYNINTILTRYLRMYRKKWESSKFNQRKEALRRSLASVLHFNKNPFRWSDQTLNQYSDLDPYEYRTLIGTIKLPTRGTDGEIDEAEYDEVSVVKPSPVLRPIDIDPLTGEGGVMPGLTTIATGSEIDTVEEEEEQSEFEVDVAPGGMMVNNLITNALANPADNSARPAATISPILVTADWTKLGKVVPVRDQGFCGACWAFASSDALSSAWAIKTNAAPALLSPQYLIDCNTQPDTDLALNYNRGCAGGMTQVAFSFHRRRAAMFEENYPYQAKQDTSNRNCVFPQSYTGIKTQSINGGKGYVQIRNDEDAILNEVRKGPLVVYVDSSAAVFRNYHSGIITEDCTRVVDHAILLIGYGIEQKTPYWLIKNSFGPKWGENGYAKIRRGANTCGIGSWAIRPTV